MKRLRNAWQWWRRTRPWGWETVRDTRITRYQVHPSGRRRVVTRPEFGYQPIDRKWEKTGEWSTWEDRLPPPKSGIFKRATDEKVKFDQAMLAARAASPESDISPLTAATAIRLNATRGDAEATRYVHEEVSRRLGL